MGYGRMQGRVAVVTGGSRGIGRATVDRLVSEGARVGIIGRSISSLNDVTASHGERVVIVRGDVTDNADLDRLFVTTVDRFGPIDALVANAASEHLVACEYATSEDFDQLSNAVLKSVFFTVQRALPHLSAPASVVLVGSIAPEMGLSGNTIYQAAKAGVRAMARGLSAELADRHIRVNVLSPGVTRTGMRASSAPASDERATSSLLAEAAANMRGRITLERPARVEEIAAGAVFLASDDSSYMLGSELIMDGGATQL
jgi:NAD(P)-dependent dehydrogenase (short-subunit alcohol dehydrogenase family)